MAGDYHVIRYGGCVAVCTLNSDDLAKTLAARSHVTTIVSDPAIQLFETSRLRQLLDPDAFVCIHRWAIVNLDRVREMQPLVRGELVVISMIQRNCG